MSSDPDNIKYIINNIKTTGLFEYFYTLKVIKQAVPGFGPLPPKIKPVEIIEIKNMGLNIICWV